MRRLSGHAALLLFAAVLALASVADAEAKLKKVPVDGKAKVIAPAKLEYKKIRPGKAVAKRRAPIAGQPRERSAPVVIDPIAIPLPNAIGESESIPLAPAADPVPRIAVDTIDTPLPAKKTMVPRRSPRSPKVYDLSAAAPTQMEVSKLKKKAAKKRRPRSE